MRVVADEIIEVPKGALLPVRSNRVSYDIPDVSPYGKYGNMVVRTAIVRARDYNYRTAPTLQTPEAVAHLCYHLTFYDQEHVAVISVGSNLRLKAIYEAAIAGASAVEFAKSNVLKTPLLVSATGAFVVHNHPSGDPTLSDADKHTGWALKDAFRCIGVQLLDFIVVATDGWCSSEHQERGPWNDRRIAQYQGTRRQGRKR